MHIKYLVASMRSYPIYSAFYLNGLRLFIFELCHITKADDMCQIEIFLSEKGVTCLISQTVTSNTTFNGL